MNIAFFLARKIRNTDQKTFTALVYKIGIVSIAMSLAIMLLGGLILEGFQKSIVHKLTSLQGQLQICQYNLNRTYEELPISAEKINNIQIALASHESLLVPYAHQTILLEAGGRLVGVICKGIDIPLSDSRFKEYIVSGRFITEKKESYSTEIILSDYLANKLQVSVGEEVMACIVQDPPRYRKLKVVGIYTTYLEEMDAKLAFCDLKLVQRLNLWPNNLVGGYEVFVKDHKQIQVIAEKILDQLDYDLVVKKTDEAYPAIRDWLIMMRKDVSIFLVLILLVAVSNIVSIVLIQVMEKSQLIGILKALGATDNLIKRTMLWNNFFIILKGIFWGNVIGLGLGILQSTTHFFTLDHTYYYVSYLPIYWNAWMIFAINIGIFALISLVFTVSVMLIAKLRPIVSINMQ